MVGIPPVKMVMNGDGLLLLYQHYVDCSTICNICTTKTISAKQAAHSGAGFLWRAKVPRYPKVYLVGGWPTPLKNMCSWMMTFPIYGKIQVMFQTTNQLSSCCPCHSGMHPIFGDAHLPRANPSRFNQRKPIETCDIDMQKTLQKPQLNFTS